MRIAIPVDEPKNTIAECFSPASLFALYDVHDDTRAVSYLGRQSFAEPNCSNTPAFLRTHNVEVVIAHDISQNAIDHLLDLGIVAIKDTQILPPDALIAHLVSGTLQATPPETAAQSGCGGAGGCGSCAHAGHAHAPESAATSCGSACSTSSPCTP